jgi:inorganic pyrophosphatase
MFGTSPSIHSPLPSEAGFQPMGLDRVNSGRAVPDDFNVVIEIPMNADPIKYEVDKDSGALFVDRFIGTAMHYPCNYGYVPNTLSDDGDPIDVLVITPFALQPGVVVRCRPLGVLDMRDEAGGDQKLLAVPIDKILPWYKHWRSPDDIAPERLAQIRHFFEHYKDLESGKWVKIVGWKGADRARELLIEAVASYQAAKEKPAF